MVPRRTWEGFIHFLLFLPSPKCPLLFFPPLRATWLRLTVRVILKSRSRVNVIQPDGSTSELEGFSLDFSQGLSVVFVRDASDGDGGSRDTAPPLAGKLTPFPKSQTSQKIPSHRLLAHLVTSITDLGCPRTPFFSRSCGERH